MKKTNRKKIVIAIILIIILIILIKFFSDSKADELMEINATISDNNGLLDMQNCTITAVDEGDNGYAITLPNLVNDKFVKKYFVENKEIVGNTNENTNEKNTNSSQNIGQEILEKNPGEKIYLTQGEIENKEINLKVEYDTKEQSDESLIYNKLLEKEIEDDKITISGYMPANAEIVATKVDSKTVEDKLQNFLNENKVIQLLYELKIVSEEKEFIPKDFEEKIEVTFNGTNIENLTNYKIIQINNEQVEEIKDYEKLADSIKFDTEELYTYAILTEKKEEAKVPDSNPNAVTNETNESEISLMAEETFETRAVIINSGSAWDGSTRASSFSWGSGTEAEPYLIADGEELAYLAQQVRNGNTYEGIYFQLANDIDLGSNSWTPIGNAQNSFRGILDGAGHTIANAVITVSSLPDSTYEAYGIFGSIGGGNSRAIIRNLELSNITVNITASGDTGSTGGSIFNPTVEQDEEGLHIGTLSGAMYKNASILNVIVTNSLIEDSNVINVYHYPFQLSIGGVVGYVGNTYNNNSNPGTNSTYQIENCYSATVIDIDATAEYSDGGLFSASMNGYGQYHTGGIVGTIRGQAVWPSNCLYSGTINSNGFIGPIFGALINNTRYDNFNRFPTIWNGNDAGNLTANNMYYTNYSANGRSFTASVTSGNSTQRISNSSTNIGYVQGVNKGIYTNNMNTILNMFNNNVTNENKYVDWYYQNGEFTFKERLTASVDENPENTFNIQITDPYQIGNYTTTWFKNGVEDTSITGLSYTWQENYIEDENMVVVIFDGEYYTVAKFTIESIGVNIVFDINETNDSVIASLTGEGLKYTSVADYTFQWYSIDIMGEETKIEGATGLTLNNLEDGVEYRLVATNNKLPQMSTENSFIYGDRTVIYVKYNGGNNRNDGFTPETPVQSLSTAYGKLDRNGTRNSNVIVLMDRYQSNDDFTDETSSTYNKPVTITGKYGENDYRSQRSGLYIYSDYVNVGWFQQELQYKYLNADTNFQFLTWYGQGEELYLLAQGYSVTIGEGVTMTNYANANTNQGLLGGNAPAVHLFAGWLQYNERQLPRNNSKILIKSGTFGRLVGGGTPGTSEGQGQTTSHDFMGSSKEDSFNVEITVDIKESTKGNYDYDINLLTGGSAAGNNYSNVIQNIKNGSVGRLIGGSIGDSADRPDNWRYPENTFLGTATINVTGGTIQELYGGCLGRNMGAIATRPTSSNLCDSYFYGTVTINISGGEITENIYGAGAGGVTGYSENSSDTYKSYGQEFDTSVNINISGGTIKGNIYGGGYGYTEYLTERVTTADGGSLYGDSNIKISGTPTIEGNIFGAGRGYNLSSKPNLASMEGNSNIEISGTPKILGKIFGAGDGISGYAEMAKLTGNSNINIESNLSTEVYGGGNIAKTEGTTNINITSGNHTGDIYGGGNLGIVEGTTNVNINGGTSKRVFAGGNQASVTTTNVYINGGTTDEVYAGGNSASVDNTNAKLQGGTANTIYGGSNQTGTIQSSNVLTTSGTAGTIYGGNNIGGNINATYVTINGGNITTAVYGGGNNVETPETHVELQNSDNEIPNIFGGGNQAGCTTTYVNTTGGSANNLFGGSNSSGTVENSNVTTNGGTIQNVYGGNNQGGVTTNPNVIINGAGVVNVYGGGNEAPSNVTNVQINGKVSGSVFGGGNQAGVNTNTNVNIIGGTVENNVYGGGNEGTVSGNTYVHVKNATLNNSLYAGGNGSSAVVYGNTNLTIDGMTTNIAKNAFGGGNKAPTGDSTSQNSISTVNIVGGTIGGNVYGGANYSVVYGVTQTNIGYDAVGDNGLEIGNVEISGTIFGGGEANEAGDENYDFSFISVTKGIDIQIDGNGHDEFAILGSIFGSGNASSTSGESYITIKNYGTPDDPQMNISLQRANCATIINSSISLSGTTDRTNEYATTVYSISRVTEVKLKNNSILYLQNGANLLTKLSSLVDDENGNEVKGYATINEETGETERNVDNRIYMKQGKVLNVSKTEKPDPSTYGEVYGMFFFGVFSGNNNPATTTSIYYHGYNNGDTIVNEGGITDSSYVAGQHYPNHDITVDGFYTNYNEDGKIRTNYITPTPPDDSYYMWITEGDMDAKVFNVELAASKYITLGTTQLLLQGFSTPNVKYIVSGVTPDLVNGVELIDPDQINPIEQDEEKANNLLGLTIEAGNVGWETNGSTMFLTENGGSFKGTTEYDKDNSPNAPTFNICLYHSQNITEKRSLGDVSIYIQVLTPINDLEYDPSWIRIKIALTSNEFQDDFYEGAITPGQKFGLFTSSDTTITNKSNFSVYFSHAFDIDEIPEDEKDNYKYYENFFEHKRALISTNSNGEPYCFTENTKFTMLDMVTNKYYYYIVTEEDVAQNKYVYYLEDFVVMGSEDSKYNEQEESRNYYLQEQNTVYENFIFHVSFADTNMQYDIENNSLLMELQNDANETLVGVLGIQRDVLKYSVYCNQDGKILFELDNCNINPEVAYIGQQIDLNVQTNFEQSTLDSKRVYDTQYFDKKLGIKLTIYDVNGNQLNNDSLLGVNFELDGQKYYPRVDGTTRIKIADKVTDVLAKIKINTENNSTLATGDYKIKIEAFGSPDGIYYGAVASDTIELEFTLISSSFGLKVTSSDQDKIVDNETGQTTDGNNSLIINLQYSSALSNPNIAISLYRRSYSDVFSQEYELVDLKDYTSNTWVLTEREKEYVISENPLTDTNYFLTLKPNLTTGTYKLVYKLYDDDTYIGEAYEYMVIK